MTVRIIAFLRHEEVNQASVGIENGLMKARREAEDPKTLTSTLPLVKAEYYMNIMIVWDNATMEKMLLLAIFDQRLQMQRQSYQNGLREQEQFPTH